MTTNRKTKFASNGSWLVIEGLPGLTIAPAHTPLTRLNYYDGKRLDASSLQLEQDAQRRLVHLSNLAGGFGVVHGFDTHLAGGDLLAVGPGQAIDAQGRLLVLPQDIEVAITELIARSQAMPMHQPGAPEQPHDFADCELVAGDPPGHVIQDGCLWLITIAHAEFACGEEDVYGKLCEQACVSSIERAVRVEGVVLRARTLELGAPLISSGAVALTDKHLRSRVASAYFTDERKQPSSMISGVGLGSEVWCFGAELAAGEVALGVLCRKGTSNQWFDAWTARRERIQSPARRYWAHRMAMRSWSAFIAQVLQFQCQLRGLPGGLPGGLSGDSGGERILIDAGIVELPPAGYLPVDPSSSMFINEQVRRLVGEGVDLRFCVVRPDDVARELEGAQHMDRISLLRGLDDPSAMPRVDILVPDGELIERTHPAAGLSFRAKLGFGLLGDEGAPTWKALVGDLDQWLSSQVRFRGAARATRYSGRGGGEVQIAALMRPRLPVDLDVEGLAPVSDFPATAALLDAFLGEVATPIEIDTLSLADEDPQPLDTLRAIAQQISRGAWLDMSCSADPLVLPLGQALSASFLLRIAAGDRLIEYRLTGSVRITAREDLQTDGETYARVAIGTVMGAETQTGFDGLAATSTSHFSVRIVDLRPSGSVNAVIVSLSPVKGQALLDHDVVIAWDGESFEVSGLWALRPFAQASVEPQLMFSALEPDPGVLAETDEDHRAALEALSAIANAMHDPGFVKEAAAKLFPPSPTGGATLEVQAIHDWVLFHARHHKQCAGEPSPRPTPERPRYRVFTREVESQDALEMLVELLASDAGTIAELAFTELGVVEYEPGVATLVSPAAEIEAWWMPHATDRALAWAGIATTVTNADQLARTRLLALEEVVELHSPAVEQQASMVLPRVPGGLERGDAEGVIVLLTLPRQAPLRISLFFADNSATERLLAIPDTAESGDELGQQFELLEVVHVGELEIIDGRVSEFVRDADATLREPTQVIAYTRSDPDSRASRLEVEFAAMLAFKQLDIATAGVPFTHLEFPFEWSSKLGDVVVVGVGQVGSDDVGPLF